MTDRELTNEMIKRADEFVEKQKREFAIAELEKIKAEIQGLIDFEESCCESAILGYECLDVIDKHISELKGEITNSKGVLEQIAEKQKTLLDTTKAWSNYIDKNGNIY